MNPNPNDPEEIPYITIIVFILALLGYFYCVN